MNFNQFTIKAQEAVQEAVNLTQARGQQAIEPVHLLQSVMKVGENVTNFIFQKLGMNGQQIALVLDKQIDSLPAMTHPASTALACPPSRMARISSFGRQFGTHRRFIASFGSPPMAYTSLSAFAAAI